MTWEIFDATWAPTLWSVCTCVRSWQGNTTVHAVAMLQSSAISYLEAYFVLHYRHFERTSFLGPGDIH